MPYQHMTVHTKVENETCISISRHSEEEVKDLFANQVGEKKIAHSFLQSVSNQFHIIILSLPM